MSTQHSPSSNHSLAFRVMRLCRPSFQAEDLILRLDPFDIFAGEDLFDESNGISPSLLDATVASAGKDLRDFSYRGRYQLQTPSDAISLPGLLMVPQSFGWGFEFRFMPSYYFFFGSDLFWYYPNSLFFCGFWFFAERFIWGRRFQATLVLTTAPVLRLGMWL